MAVGKKSNGKHWTKAEVESRQAAADGMKRKAQVSLRVPDWLEEDARKIWYQTISRIRGLELLDISDTEMLAIYCDAVAKYRGLSKGLVQVVDEEDQPVAMEEHIKMIQAWARLIAAYAEKLGLTPAAKARLAKRKADEILDDFGSEFDS